MSSQSLTRVEAQDRAALIRVTSMTVDLDLDQGPERFGSTTRIRFACHQPGAATFVDLKPVEVSRLELNGIPLDHAQLHGGRLLLDDLAADNELLVQAGMAYSRDGQGLHRAEDPADGEHYVYGHLFLDAAPSVFACFDQPDLKAPYTVSVKAPADWLVLGNGAATRDGAATSDGAGRWRLAETKPLATYFVTVCAGPYASVRSEHDGIPLGIHARASLREHLERQAPQMLEVTRAGLDYYHGLFGIRYPFGEYHQVFVPEFNAGAMENPGCVTIRDQYVFRGAAARDEVLTRTNTITHEMAHMWFGDLVTMRWWDDLWLNESFAEYMAHRTSVDATEFTDAWVDATMARKIWGYAAERTPSTHPVAGSPAPDAESALQNFDGISYAKGAAVLRQLIASIGDRAFIAGVRAYLGEHAYGNGTLADFLGAMERSAGRDLSSWSKAWLESAGADLIGIDRSGRALTRKVPHAFPAERAHTLDLAAFADGSEVFRSQIELASSSLEVPEVGSVPPGAVVVPNASDLTWATVALDRASVEALPAQLPRLPDAQARAVTWAALIDGAALATVDPRHVVRTFAAAWPAETNASVLNRASAAVLATIIPRYLPFEEQAAAEAQVAAAAAAALESSRPGSTEALVAARVLARSSADTDGVLGRWLRRESLPQGLEHDSDFHWLVVRGMARHGAIDVATIEAARAEDDTLPGRLGALGARAVLPNAGDKTWAWRELTANRKRSNYELNALALGFWLTPDVDLLRPYVSRYFDEVPAMAEWVGEDALARVALYAFPLRLVESATADLSAHALTRTDLSPAVRRSMVDADSELREALRSRARFS
jgi:aminopeptidase N